MIINWTRYTIFELLPASNLWFTFFLFDKKKNNSNKIKKCVQLPHKMYARFNELKRRTRTTRRADASHINKTHHQAAVK